MKSATLSSDRRLAVSASLDTTRQIWELESGQDLRTLAGPEDAVSGVAVTPTVYCVGLTRTHAQNVGFTVGQEIRKLTVQSDGVTAVSINPGGKGSISASVDGSPELWDLRTGRSSSRWVGTSTWFLESRPRRMGYLISASSDQTLKIWDLDSGCCFRTVRVSLRPGICGCFRRRRQVRLSTSVDKSIIV